MRRLALLLAVALAAAACSTPDAAVPTTTVTTIGPSVQETTTTSAPTPAGEFPGTFEADNGLVTIESKPESIVSLSPVATEMLFAIGAGSQVVAVDEESNYPSSAPMTDLSGFTPNLEAILSFDPDLVVISFGPADLVEGLETAGVPVVVFGAAATVDDVFAQMRSLGAITGNLEAAQAAADQVEKDFFEAVASSVSSGEGVTYYHEIDALLYTATSQTFFGEIYGMFGMLNIADPADEDGSAAGYPQLTSEFVVASDPDIIFLANVLYGESAETVAARPGWDVMRAVQNGDIVELDSDVASRWGPRIVDFAWAIADALRRYYGG